MFLQDLWMHLMDPWTSSPSGSLDVLEPDLIVQQAVMFLM